MAKSSDSSERTKSAVKWILIICVLAFVVLGIICIVLKTSETKKLKNKVGENRDKYYTEALEEVESYEDYQDYVGELRSEFMIDKETYSSVSDDQYNFLQEHYAPTRDGDRDYCEIRALYQDTLCIVTTSRLSKNYDEAVKHFKDLYTEMLLVGGYEDIRLKVTDDIGMLYMEFDVEKRKVTFDSFLFENSSDFIPQSLFTENTEESNREIYRLFFKELEKRNTSVKQYYYSGENEEEYYVYLPITPRVIKDIEYIKFNVKNSNPGVEILNYCLLMDVFSENLSELAESTESLYRQGF